MKSLREAEAEVSRGERLSALHLAARAQAHYEIFRKATALPWTITTASLPESISVVKPLLAFSADNRQVQLEIAYSHAHRSCRQYWTLTVPGQTLCTDDWDRMRAALEEQLEPDPLQTIMGANALSNFVQSGLRSYLKTYDDAVAFNRGVADAPVLWRLLHVQYVNAALAHPRGLAGCVRAQDQWALADMLRTERRTARSLA